LGYENVNRDLTDPVITGPDRKFVTGMCERREVYVVAKGKVQEVMFRKTLVRASHKYGVEAGGTNSKVDSDVVEITVAGESDKIDSFLEFLSSGKKLNSIGAQIFSLEPMSEGLRVGDHVTHTGQFGSMSFPTDVVFYV
jgi:acylphosphatase